MLLTIISDKCVIMFALNMHTYKVVCMFKVAQW